MVEFLSYTPEVLHQYRLSVTDWLQEAIKALDSFSDPTTGSYFRDSTQKDASKTLTTPARTYMALVSASRHSPAKQSGAKRTWVDAYTEYSSKITVSLNGDELANSQTKLRLNNFEIAKFSDLTTVNKFLERFHGKTVSVTIGTMEKAAAASITKAISDVANHPDGEAYIDGHDPNTRHFFVTLHLLRAAHAHAIDLDRGEVARIVAAAKQYCIKQCYYATRTVQHRADPARLAFAGVIYCQYEDDLDPDLIVAVTEALAAFQRPTGNWPAIHPILRRDNPDNPWYIATHDLALCLSWLYFQPRVPEAARAVILHMMENYFLRWVIPTFRQSEGAAAKDRMFSGWSDDRATGGDMVVGWASAVVCHFLANYLDVLDDVINRRVIESLGLQGYAQKYLVEEGQPQSNPRFSVRHNKGCPTPIWIDLPPLAWPQSSVDDCADRAKTRIISQWTEPTEKNAIADALAKQIIRPIFACSDFVVGSKSVGILNGPPGTRKTSLVTSIAEILEWPYVPVPASVFFDNGFDMMEARASEVFRRLNFMTYCVILFDEFEEFFKDREPKGPSNDGRNGERPQGSDSRTIAAFTTSAMLPRLQDLHDRRKCIIFLATNHIEKIDEAIIRPGRFDYSLFIDHPKVRRFTQDDSFFSNPGSRTLTKLHVEFDSATRRVRDSDKAKLEQICLAVKEALNSNRVEGALIKFNESDAVKNWARSPMVDPPKGAPSPAALYIWFRFVESALEAASEKLNAGGSGAEAQEAAELKLTAEIEYYSGKGRKGPATLDGLSDDY